MKRQYITKQFTETISRNLNKMIEKKERRFHPATVFQPNASFPDPTLLLLKFEKTIDSCRLVEHLEVADQFFSTVLHRALREGYYTQGEAQESATKLRALLDRQYRELLARNHRHL